MRLFLSFLGWFFGLIFLAGSIPYFWCGEFFLGLWSLIVVIILIPPLYKYVSGRFKFSYSKAKIMVFSLIIFFALFANFVRPVFDPADSVDIQFIKHYEELVIYLEKTIETNMLKKNDTQKVKCIKYLNMVQTYEMFSEKSKKLFYSYEKNKKLSNIMKLELLLTGEYIYHENKQKKNEAKKFLKYKCGNI